MAELAANDNYVHHRAAHHQRALGADQILVLDHGRIAERGTHQQLLRSGPIYREIYESQLGEVARAKTGGDSTLLPQSTQSLNEYTENEYTEKFIGERGIAC